MKGRRCYGIILVLWDTHVAKVKLRGSDEGEGCDRQLIHAVLLTPTSYASWSGSFGYMFLFVRHAGTEIWGGCRVELGSAGPLG